MDILQGIHPIFPLGFSLKHAPFCGMLKIFIGLFMCQFFTAYYLPVEKSVFSILYLCVVQNSGIHSSGSAAELNYVFSLGGRVSGCRPFPGKCKDIVSFYIMIDI